jgi:hypothetical protein
MDHHRQRIVRSQAPKGLKKLGGNGMGRMGGKPGQQLSTVKSVERIGKLRQEGPARQRFVTDCLKKQPAA